MLNLILFPLYESNCMFATNPPPFKSSYILWQCVEILLRNFYFFYLHCVVANKFIISNFTLNNRARVISVYKCVNCLQNKQLWITPLQILPNKKAVELTWNWFMFITFIKAQGLYPPPLYQLFTNYWNVLYMV